MSQSRYATGLEFVRVVVPDEALEAYEAAIGQACRSVAMFIDEATGLWTIEGVREQTAPEPDLAAMLALAAAATGYPAALDRTPASSEGWLARSFAAFPEMRIGPRFVVRGSHLQSTAPLAGRILLRLDAALAFGSGEHASTRGCLRALERIGHRRPARILDVGTGTGILAIAAARLWGRHVLATDIDPWAVRTARDNVRRNGVSHLVKVRVANGPVGVGKGYDLLLANILARPLALMAGGLASCLRRGGTLVLAGLLTRQAPWVIGAYRRRGLVLERRDDEGGWSTLILRRPAHLPLEKAGSNTR